MLPCIWRGALQFVMQSHHVDDVCDGVVAGHVAFLGQQRHDAA